MMSDLGYGIVVALGCVALMSVAVSPAAAEEWVITTVDASGDVGDYSSIAIMPSGMPAISYFDLRNSALKYAWQDQNGWHTTTVDDGDDVGAYTSLVILPTGYPAISYQDVGQDTVNYAWQNERGWHTEIVDRPFMGSFGTSLAVLPSGDPAISYRDHWNGWLKYAWREGGEWNATVVDDDGNLGHHSGLAILPSGDPAISYIDSTEDRLMYAWLEDGVWQKTASAAPGGLNSRLVMLPSGDPAIVHDASGGIRYVWRDGNEWQSTGVDEVEGFESWFGHAGMAIGSGGEPSMCYIRRQFPDAAELIYAWLQGGVWQTTLVQVGGSAQSSLTFLASGRPAISFRDARSLKYATLSGGCVRDPAWQCDGDVDGDGQVNPVDSGLVQAAFGSTDDQALCNYDVDCDGQINPVDSGIVQSLFGSCEAVRSVCP